VRVTLLNQYYAPDEAATAQILADLGARLVSAGHEVAAICSDRSYASPDRRYPRRETLDGVSVRRARATGFGRQRKLGRIADYATFMTGAFFQAMRGPRPDVIVALSTPPLLALLGTIAARLRRAKVVFWVMDVYPDLAFELGVLAPRSVPGRVLKRLSAMALKAADRVIALDDAMAKRLTSQAPVRVDVVRNWAEDAPPSGRGADGHALRARWGWQGRFVVLYSGNMGLAHEFDTVLAAAHALAGHADILFAFVGGGPRRAEVEAEVRRRRLPNVEFRPYVPRKSLGESLAAGDVHLVTLRPGLAGMLVPSKIYGILAAGRPVLYVGPDEGDIAEIVEEHRCGLRIRPGDADGLVAAVLSYGSDETRRHTDGERGRALYEERFTKEKGTRAMLAVIESLG
jgi:glycosyltransferase involved in cell wall biosynthesis